MKNRCSYAELGIYCGQEYCCDGYNTDCHMYTTQEHLDEFNEIFDLPNNDDYNSLEKLFKLNGENWLENEIR